MNTTHRFLSAALALGLAAAAHANLLVNGDFATDSTAGWTFTPAAHNSDFGIDRGGFSGVQPAAHYAGFGDTANPSDFPGSYDELSQTLSTVAGDEYQISYDWAANSFSYFYSFFGGVALQSESNTGSVPWTHETFDVTATGSSTVVSFYGNNVPAWTAFTNADVEDLGVAGVPDTATTFALLAAGLGGLIVGRRRLVRA